MAETISGYEQALIAGLLAKPEYAAAIVLNPSDFDSEMLGAIFSVIRTAESATPVTLTEELTREGKPVNSQLLYKLFALKPESITKDEVDQYVQKIRRDAVRRRFQRKVVRTVEVLRDGDLDTAIDSLSSAVLTANKELISGTSPDAQAIIERMENQKEREFFNSGLDHIDKATGGMRHGHIWIITAPYKQRKCVDITTSVITPDGIVELSEIVPNDLPFGLTETDTPVFGRDVMERASHWYRSEAGQTIKITTKRGFELTGTPDHPVLTLTPDGREVFVPLKDITEGTWLSSRKGMRVFPESKITTSVATLLGYLTGDGCVSSEHATMFSNPDRELVDDFYRIMRELGFKESKFIGSADHRIYSTDNRTFLYELGLDYTTAGGKDIPLVVRQSGRDVQAAFIRAYMDCDGWVAKGRHKGVSVKALSKSEKLIKQLQLMLLNFGILSAIRISRVKYNGELRDYWEITITADYAVQYAREIGFLHERKRRKLQEYVDIHESIKTRRDLDIIPVSTEYMQELYAPCNGSGLNSVFNRTTCTNIPRRLTRTRAKTIAEKARTLAPHVSQCLDNLAGDTKFYDEIVRVEEGPVIETYDFTVPGSHAFWSNGLISHNTSTALHMAKSVLDQGRSVAYIALEDDDTAFVQVLMAMVGDFHVGFFDVPERNRTQQMRDKMQVAFDWIQDKKFRVYDAKSGVHNFNNVPHIIRNDKIQYNTDLVIVDYVQAWTESYEEITKIAQELLKVAAENDVCVLELSQVSGATMKEGSARGVLATKGSQTFGGTCHVGMELRYDKTRAPRKQNILKFPDDLGSAAEVGVHLKVARRAPNTWNFLMINPESGKVYSQSQIPLYPSKPGAVD